MAYLRRYGDRAPGFIHLIFSEYELYLIFKVDHHPLEANLGAL